MTEKVIITKEMFEQFAQVGEVELTPAEAESMIAKMNEQIKVIDQLSAIPLDADMPAVVHGNPYPQEIRIPLREDVWTPFENVDGILAEAPRTQDGYIVAPDVPHQKLS